MEKDWELMRREKFLFELQALCKAFGAVITGKEMEFEMRGNKQEMPNRISGEDLKPGDDPTNKLRGRITKNAILNL